jgi:3-dehydroquinate dehydratase/shikimate dehydrogenase
MNKPGKVLICVPLCVENAGDIDEAIAGAKDRADMIELRLDCLKEYDFEEVERQISKASGSSIPQLIIARRPLEQAGNRYVDYDWRLRFWRSRILLLLTNYRAFADIEMDLAAELEPHHSFLDWNRVICSHHDFESVPSDLVRIYERMASGKARVMKIAVQANDITDCIPVLRQLERAKSEGRKMIAIAMGDAGLMTRILGPSRGAFLTYGSLDESRATAPGQLSAKDLRDLYRIDRISQETKIFGLVGQPVTHSVSPHIHNAAFAAGNFDAVYIPFEVIDLDAFMQRMVRPTSRELDWNLRGFSVTAPHKRAIVEHLDWIEPSALAIGAVNTVVIDGDQLHGYNTDAVAALAPLRRLMELKDANVAVIGAGGAARAIVWSLRDEGARVTVFARDAGRGAETAELIGADHADLSGAKFDEFDIVINATPAGTRGETETETVATAEQLRGAGVAYDLVYNPAETRFMREASEAGCQVVGGLEMLVAQAAIQFQLWTGSEPPVETMREAAVAALVR